MTVFFFSLTPFVSIIRHREREKKVLDITFDRGYLMKLSGFLRVDVLTTTSFVAARRNGPNQLC